MESKMMEVKARMEKAAETRFERRPVRCPSIKAMAAYINAVCGLKFSTNIERTSCHKDRDLAGTRLRKPGKREYSGWVLTVYRKSDCMVVFKHNTTETYRKNVEVAEWILQNVKES